MSVSRWILTVWTLIALNASANEPGKEGAQVDTDQGPTIAETVTVTAELVPVKLKEATAKVSVIDESQIASQVVNDLRDLVKYEPGVYITHDGSRLGLNGFNIRGIGGNRVLTRIDGVATSDQFAFGPLSIHQVSLDVDTLKTVEILRGASSSLYGSDALGGVVSFDTKDPEDYLRKGSGDHAFSAKAGFDSKSDATDLGMTGAFNFGTTRASIAVTRREFEARENMGTIETFDSSRTAPNDLDGTSTQILGKLVQQVNDFNRLRLTLSYFENAVDTLYYSGQGTTSIFGMTTTTSDYVADDLQERLQLSLDQDVSGLAFAMMDSFSWQIHYQQTDTDQATSEVRSTTLPTGGVQNIRRDAAMNFEQDRLGLNVTIGKSWSSNQQSYRLTYGVEYDDTDFGQLRDRTDFDLDTNNPDAYMGTLIFPTRYFPNTTVEEYGAFVQLEGRFFDDHLKLTPGLRYDDYQMTPDANDRIFLDSTGSDIPPVGLDDSAVSPKLGVLLSVNENVSLVGHYSQGFRAPSYASVNSGFTNLSGGYQSLPNPELTPEESENLELGFRLHSDRGSLNVNWFDNQFDDFIADTIFVGVSDTGLALFQSQNLNNVEISGLEVAGDFYFHEQFAMKFSYASIEGEDRDTSAPIESIEPDKGVLGFLWNRSDKRFGVELTATHVASRSLSDVSEETAFLPDSYTLMDMTLFYELSSQFKAYLGGFNLTDETYYPWSDVRGRQSGDPLITRYSAPGRNVSFNIRYQF